MKAGLPGLSKYSISEKKREGKRAWYKMHIYKMKIGHFAD
jgi:hypothetical protein